MKEYQSHIIALVGTLLLLLLLLLMLLKLSIVAPIQLEDEGIVITFGDADEGGGMPDVLPMPDPITQVEQQPSAPVPTPVQPSDNDLMVQEDEESLAKSVKTAEYTLPSIRPKPVQAAFLRVNLTCRIFLCVPN